MPDLLVEVARRLADFWGFRLDWYRPIRRGKLAQATSFEKNADLPRLVGLARLKTGRPKLGDIDVISSTSVVCRYKVIHYDCGSGQRG